MAEWLIISAALGKVHLPVTIVEQIQCSFVSSKERLSNRGGYNHCVCVQCCVFDLVLLVSVAV